MVLRGVPGETQKSKAASYQLPAIGYQLNSFRELMEFGDTNRLSPAVSLGLLANRGQFALLVLVNAFVGAMVGLERTTLPLIAEQDFGIASRSAVLSFIATFGVVKALANLVAGPLADRHGRKKVLIAGWLSGVPVPFILMWAPTWSWIVAANVLLGINQGLAWTMTVTMKIDLAGPSRRGLAMGLNEFAGYVAVGLAALATGLVAERFGLRPEPFYLGIGFVAIGLALTLFALRDTMAHVWHESGGRYEPARTGRSGMTGLIAALRRASWSDPALSSASQAGLVNNLNDGLAWGLFPLFFAAGGASVEQIGVLAAIYPVTWGLAQLWTGAMSDRWGRKRFITYGMLTQAAALGGIALVENLSAWIAGSVLLGLGTAMVYPTLLASVADVAGPLERGAAVGAYRLWRDLGYAAGALVAGILADAFGIPFAIGVVAALTAASGAWVAIRMPETLLPRPRS